MKLLTIMLDDHEANILTYLMDCYNVSAEGILIGALFGFYEDDILELESLAERTRSFTDEEWEFYKKVNREKMHKTGLNIYDLLNKKEE